MLRRMKRLGCVFAVICGVAIGAPPSAAAESLPVAAHIVIVIEENKPDSAIIGSKSAPYINALASSGANMIQSFAESHPSEPNYLALFSGSTQGVRDNHCGHTFAGVPNLDFPSLLFVAGVLVMLYKLALSRPKSA